MRACIFPSRYAALGLALAGLAVCAPTRPSAPESSSLTGVETVNTMRLTGPDGATPEALEAAGRGLAARCEIAGYPGVQYTVHGGEIELTREGGFAPEMQFRVATLGFFPARLVELRPINRTVRQPDTIGPPKHPLTLEAIRALEAPPDSVWMPYQHLSVTRRQLHVSFDEAIRAYWRECLVRKTPSIPLSVPVPLTFCGGATYFEFTEDRRRLLGDWSLGKEGSFALCVDGFVLVQGYTEDLDPSKYDLDDPRFILKDQHGNTRRRTNPLLVMAGCGGFDIDVKAIVSIALPFALTVSKGRAGT